MIPHHICHILDGNLPGRLHEKREPLCLVIAHRIVDVFVCVMLYQVAVLILVCETAVAKDVECRPGPCLAASHATELERVVGIAEAEILV